MSLCSNAVLFGLLFTDANALGRLRSMPRAKLRAVKLAEWRLEILGPIGLSTKYYIGWAVRHSSLARTEHRCFVSSLVRKKKAIHKTCTC